MDTKPYAYAEVIIDISHEKLDHPFTYRIPDTLRGTLKPGDRVEVPFGKGDTGRQGYVVGLAEHCDLPAGKVKEITSLSAGKTGPGTDDGSERAVELAAWMKERYGSTFITALKTVLPMRREVRPLQQKTLVLTAGEEEARERLALYRQKHQIARARLLEGLLEVPEQPYALATDKLHVTAATVRSLENSGLLRVEVETSLRNPVRERNGEADTLELSSGQQDCIRGVLDDFDRKKATVSLLHGITGSGKTEVYIRIAEGIVARGRQVIVLIPEIALTYQTLLRFYAHFGDRVSVMNSTLSAGEKHDQFRRAREGGIDVIIGPRSALFTPFPKLGAIIMDEEQENSYKNENMPKYHARDVAVRIAAMQGAVVLLGSATPSLESYYLASAGTYRLYELNSRLTGGTLPAAHIVDMREELKEGNRTMFSSQLQSLMEDRLSRKEQTILFLNRRGYAGFVSCRACGHVMKCPHCSVSLSEHMHGRLVCHYCGYEQPAVRVCPECGSRYIAGFRAGTEQIEIQLQRMYPQARVLRMDADTTARKESYEKILSSFANEEADILLGTQMIVKGHDFPNVTLVGVLMADLSLNAGDYRASERTFQLLTQAAGRAGRGTRPGEVVIQTYEPDNYAVRAAAAQDYRAFYDEEIRYRQLLQYPPVCHMLAVQIQDRDEDTALAAIGEVRGMLETEDGAGESIVIGPSAAATSKLRDSYRFVVYIKNAKYDKLVRYKDRIEEYWKGLTAAASRFFDTQLQFDFDPVNPY
ncbi:MAG: primosomal protein N' [Lachnospiraceae bacterium]|nr:primosomal protein N' [Lachnospiraceae bacterium]